MFKIILCLIKCCWLSVIKYCRLKPFYCVGPQKCLLRKGMCTLSWFLHENFWDCVTGKRGHSQSVAWYIDEEGIWFGLEEKKKSVNRFFTLFPVVVWEVASETVSALLMLLHLFSFGSGGEYLYHRVTSLQKCWFCNNRVVQEGCNQFERQWPKQAEITLQLLKGFMWPWWFTPCLCRYGQTVPGEIWSREGTNTSNRTENRELRLQMSDSESLEVWLLH